MWIFKKIPPAQPKDEFIQPETVPPTEYRWDANNLYWINKKRAEVGMLPLSEYTGEEYDPSWGWKVR